MCPVYTQCRPESAIRLESEIHLGNLDAYIKLKLAVTSVEIFFIGKKEDLQ